jgi:hypothetical protein
LTSISLHESALAATNVARRSYTSWLTAWRESVEVATRYWAGAAARGATPFDVAADGERWRGSSPTGDRRTGASPNDIELAPVRVAPIRLGPTRPPAPRAAPAGGTPFVRRRLQP